MSETIVREIVETRIQDNWVATEVDWDNVKYNPKAGTPYITPVISEVDSIRRSKKCIKRTYTVIVEIRVAKNSGTNIIGGYANVIKNLFEGYAEGHFICIKGRVERVGHIGKWYQRNVILDCRYTEYK